MRCRLCGHRFDETKLACHSQCPLGKRCSLICCPNCGYQVVDESRTLLGRTLRRLLPGRPRGPRKVPEVPGVPLTHVPVATEVRVVGLDGMPAPRLSRLTAFGLAPGCRLRVLQRKPVPVVRVGETEIALSEEILGQIRVEPPEAA
ncbi:MAG TPA: FeoA family protein [Actinomycetota bacterium]|nr:FeoA family protein [Actinomycetota bacterium]